MAAAVVLCIVALTAPNVRGQVVTKEACLDAHLANQKLRRDGKLSAARAQLLICVKSACPEPVRLECARWMGEIDQQIPTIVVAAKDDRGVDTADVLVMVDGAQVADRIDGRPIAIDPGPHRVSCQYKGQLREQDIVVQQGAKSRQVSCDFTVASAQPPGSETKPPPGDDGTTVPPAGAEADRGVPVAAYIFGGLSVAAFASFAAFGIVGKNEADDLRESCGEDAPPPLTKTCTDDQIDPVRAKLIAADVSLGVGVGLLAVSVGLFLHHYLSAPEPAATAVRIDFGPTDGGAQGLLTVGF